MPVAGLELGALLGVGARVTNLSGAVGPAQTEVSVWRANLGGSGEISVGARPVDEVWLGVRGQLDVVVNTQRYVAGGGTALALNRAAPAVSIGAEVAFDP